MQPNPLQVERLTKPYPKNKASITGQARSKTTTRTLFSPLRSESTANSSTPIGKHQPTISLLQVSRGGQGGGSHADRSSVRKSGRRNTKHKKCYGRRRIRRAGGWRRAIGSAAYRRLDLGTCRSVLCMYAIYAVIRQMTFFFVINDNNKKISSVFICLLCKACKSRDEVPAYIYIHTCRYDLVV
jgi:hypothetical protein